LFGDLRHLLPAAIKRVFMAPDVALDLVVVGARDVYAELLGKKVRRFFTSASSTPARVIS
jgi:hypothetical protein